MTKRKRPELQPELLPLEGPAPPAADPCSVCGSRAVVLRLGVAICTECGKGAAQAQAADRVAEMNRDRRRKFGRKGR